MAERMTSPEEAEQLREVIIQCVDDLVRAGFSRVQVGAAMCGIGAGIVAAHDGYKEGLRVIDGTRDALVANEGMYH